MLWIGQITPILKHWKADELMRTLIEETGRLLGLPDVYIALKLIFCEPIN